MLEFYGKNAELKEQLKAPIFEEKTVDFILELAKVNEKSVTPRNLLKAAREAEEDKPADERRHEAWRQIDPGPAALNSAAGAATFRAQSPMGAPR